MIKNSGPVTPSMPMSRNGSATSMSSSLILEGLRSIARRLLIDLQTVAHWAAVDPNTP
eukprot:CAMPEP_0195587498 /NCGR_PEP_ID=MMETSP0814-20130614/31102_1 /TAXON_ID=97485 /ORGANISM="Prymnesium parvum, Strain Texoma1" /LENGTH=57 /DNA_ID=CAMNT_0040726277 /DNA_START=22 /DNA_END=195 /DNA_ORIENTATION=-